MLNFVLGTTGSGKSTLLRQKVKETVEAGNKAIVIVPEQASFETEKALYELLGAENAIHVEVLSFTRLCNRIFREYGGLAGDYIDDPARLLLMSLTLNELKDMLQVYSGKIHNVSFVETLVAQISEFKNAGVTAELLEDFAQNAGADGLAGKASELATIYSVYQAMIDRSYQDSEDDMTRACGYLECNDFFGGYHIFIDSFKAFMANEYGVLAHMLTQSPQVTITLCTDTLEDSEGGLGLFSPVKKTAARLKRMAEECGVAAQTAAVLTAHPRYQNNGLAHLEQNIFRSDAQPYELPCAGIRLVAAQNQYEEVEYIAAAIREAVRTEGMRYRDIALIGRELSAYEQAFESIFERYEIPYFMDAREDITGKPLTAAILHAVEAARGRFDTDEILALLKTSLLGIPPEEISALENYCFVWDIRGDQWLTPFTANPAGFGEPSQHDLQQLLLINRLREQAVTPLLELHNAVQSCDGTAFAKAVFHYLENSGILAMLRSTDAQQDDPIAEDCARLYDTVITLLEQFATALAGVQLTPARFAELLRLVLGSVDIGILPQTLDQVIIGSADRIRVNEPKIVFLVGANEGIFPAAYQAGGIFSDAERERMIHFGLEISDTAQSKALDETFYAYTALCCASEQLVLCYSRSNLKGGSLYPSALVKNVRSVLPLALLQNAEEEDRAVFVQNEKTAFDIFCQSIRQNNQFTAALREYLCENGAEERVQRLLHPVKPKGFTLRNRETVKALYGRDMRVSPSKLDRYHQCKMAYFCRYGLGLLPRRKAELSPLESGTVVHFVLQTLLSKYGGDGLAALTPQALRTELRTLLEQYIEEHMGGIENKTARFKYLFTRLENTLVTLVQHLAQEFEVCEFRPLYFELPIQKTQPNTEQGVHVEPLEFDIATGGKVFVEGVVDRVDVLEKGGKKYLRVVDYKTGSKEFNLSDVYYGMNLQMLVYLFTIRAMGQGALADTTPAGILYMPAKTQFSALERDAPPEKAQRKQMEALRMNGLLLQSMEALAGMEKGGEGQFIPAAFQEKGGEVICKGSVATLEEFGKLERYVEKLVVDMANTLRTGAIGALPTYTKGFDKVCEYCEYHGICGREDQDARVDALQKTREEFFAVIDEEDVDGKG